MNQEDILEALRAQLYLAIKFMDSTPAPPEHSSFNWAGSMPASPGRYHPVDWEAVNYRITTLWNQFLIDLLWYKMEEKYQQAKELEIADLLVWTADHWKKEFRDVNP